MTSEHGSLFQMKLSSVRTVTDASKTKTCYRSMCTCTLGARTISVTSVANCTVPVRASALIPKVISSNSAAKSVPNLWAATPHSCECPIDCCVLQYGVLFYLKWGSLNKLTTHQRFAHTGHPSTCDVRVDSFRKP